MNGTDQRKCPRSIQTYDVLAKRESIKDPNNIPCQLKVWFQSYNFFIKELGHYLSPSHTLSPSLSQTRNIEKLKVVHQLMMNYPKRVRIYTKNPF